MLPEPGAHDGKRFFNFKVPVFAKVVDPPHARVETQRACIAAIFAAARAIEMSERRPKDCRVACLVTTPSLFQSEVTVFLDADYFRTFLPQATSKRTHYDGGWVEAETADEAMIAAIRPPEPEGLAFQGGVLMRQVDDSWGPAPVEQATWVWAYPRR